MADEFIRDDENLTLADGDSAAGQSTTVEVGADGAVMLPAGVNFGNAEFAQSGSDMVVTAPDGTEVVIEGYFDQESAPMLKTPGGAELAGDTATHLARVLSPTQEVAQAAPTADAQPIGQVDSVSGTVVAIRANGDRVELEAGDPVFQGDVLQSGEEGAVGIVLADETTFSMAENGRMVLDEMVYDPGTQEGSISMSVLQGVFTFVSGQVAKVDPDAMTLKTPVATIGIRGTQVGIDLGETADGTPDLRVVLMEESDGFVGEVVIANAGGIQILNLPDQGSTVSDSNSAPAEPRVFQRSEIRESFSDALDSLPTAVGTGNDYAPREDERQEQEEQQENEDAAAEEAEGEQEEATEESIEGESDEFAEADGEEGGEGEDLEDFETAAGGEEDAAADGEAEATVGGEDGEVDEDLEDFETAGGGEEEEGAADDAPDDGTGDFVDVTGEFEGGVIGGGGGSTGDVVEDGGDDGGDRRTEDDDTRDDLPPPPPPPEPQPPVVTLDAAVGDEDTAIELTISATIPSGSPGQLQSVTISNIPEGATISLDGQELVLTPHADGTSSIQLSPAQLTGLTIQPGLDENADFDLEVSAANFDQITGSTATGTGTLDVTVNATVDPAVVTAAPGTGTGDEDTAIAVDISTELADADGTVTSLTITDIPDGAVLMSGDTVIELTGPDADGLYSAVLSPDQLTGLTITPDQDDAHDFSLNITATSTDIDPDMVDNADAQAAVNDAASAQSAEDAAVAASDAADLAITEAQSDLDAAIEARDNPDPEATEADLAVLETAVSDAETALATAQSDAADAQTAEDSAIATSDAADAVAANYAPSIAAVEAVAEAEAAADAVFEAEATLSDAETAAADAQTAEENAIAASDAADLAVTDAETAVSDAEAALAEAVNAPGGSTEAEITVLEAAVADAETALGDATQAASDAATAETDAIAASDTADVAVTDATTALSDAQTVAETTAAAADDAVIAAADAAVAAEAELASATSDAAEAQAAEDLATAASNAADAVVADAQTALDDATTALTDANAAVSPDAPTEAEIAELETAVADAEAALTAAETDAATAQAAEDSAATASNAADTVEAEAQATYDALTTGHATNTSETFAQTVEVIATVDAPEVTTLDASGDEDTAIALDITATVDEIDIPDGTLESITIGDIPDGATLTYVDDTGATVELTVTNGSVTLSPDQLNGLAITPLEDDAGDFDLSVSATAVDIDPDFQIAVDAAETAATDATTALSGAQSAATAADTAEADAIAASDAADVTAADAETAVTDAGTALLEAVDAGATDAEVVLLETALADAETALTDANIAAADAAIAESDAIAASDAADAELAEAQTTADAADATLADAETALANGEVSNTSEPVNLNVEVIATVDAPELAAEDASGFEDTAIPLDITATVDTIDIPDGTLESITVTGFPAGATVTYTDATGATVELAVTDGGITLSPDQLNGLAVTPAEDDANDFDLTVTATATDTDPDTGAVVTNTSDPVPLAVTVTATVDAPEVVAQSASGDEDTAIPLEITATVDEIGIPDGTLQSITIGDIPSGATLTYTDDTGATVELTVTDGSVTLSPEQLTGLQITLLEDDANDFDLTVTATATDTDPDTGAVVTNTSDPVPLSVEVIATVDAPEVTAQDASGDEDTAIPLDITATVDEIDIPDGTLQSITIGDIPAGATLTYTDDTGATVELTVTDGSVTLSPEQLNGLAITPAEDDANDFDLSVSATATDTDPDTGETVTNTSVPVVLAVVVLATAEVEISAQDATGAENTAIPLDITASVDVGDDTLESVTIGDIPPGATITYVDSAGVTQEIIVTDGSVTLSPEQLNGLALTPPTDDVSDFALSVSATSTDTDPDTGEIVTATDGPVPLNVVVTGGNVAPEAGDDVVSGIEDIPVVINFDTLLANDEDADGDILEITAVNNPVGGTVEIVDGQIVFTPDADYSGTATFDYTVTDPDGLTSTATTTVDIEAVADAPLVSVNVTMVSQTFDDDDVEDLDGVVHQFRAKDDDSPDIKHGAESVYDVDIEAALVDTDGSESLSTIEVTGLPSGATLSAGTLNPDGSWTLTSEQLDGLQMTLDPTVPDDFELTVSVTSTEESNLDSATSSSSASIVVNLEPDAVDDAMTLNEDAATIIDLTANDTDPDGDPLSVVEITHQPHHGTVVINEDGTVTYTPDADYNGSDHFTYMVSDGAGGFDTARVNLTVDPVNDAPVAVDDTAVIDEDSSVNLNVMANDYDVDGGEMFMDSVTQPEHGTVTINGNGTVTYTPDANYNGADSFTYTIVDGDGATSTATVELTVNPGDDVPVAVADVATLDEDSSAIIDALSNDTSADGDFSLDSFTQPEHGLVTVNADGNFVYTPDANYNGGDSFTYTIVDADGDVSTAIVSVAVNPVDDPVVAVEDSAILNEDAAAVIDVLANDTAVDGGLELTGVTQPLHGTVSINDDGTVTYTPAENYNGTDSFTYSITDADGDTSTATVSLTINPANDDPVAVDDSATLSEDTSAVIDVLANDSDLDGDTVSLDSVTQPEHGTVVINADGTVTYTPDADYNGSDSFTYTISDGAGGTDTATVNLTVDPENDDPVAVDDNAVLAEDTAAVIDVLGNDTDLDGDTISLDSVTQPDHGTVTINEDGTVTYTPDANYTGSDSFTYQISDGAGGTDTAVVNLTVNSANDVPVAVADVASLDEDSSAIIDALANDMAADGGLALDSFTQPEHGVVTVNADGNFVYTPEANYNGGDSFTYTITDADGDTSTAIVSVAVNPVNDPVVAVDDAAVLNEDAAAVIDVLANDTAVDGGLELTGVTQPLHGTVSINDDGTVTYTPAENYNGTDSFTYTITDADGDTSTATVSLTINPENDDPVAVNDTVSGIEDIAVVINPETLLANDTDVDGGVLEITAVDSPVGGTVEIVDGNVVFTPDANFSGSASFDYTVTDASGATSTATTSVNVEAVADAPTLSVGIAEVEGSGEADLFPVMDHDISNVVMYVDVGGGEIIKVKIEDFDGPDASFRDADDLPLEEYVAENYPGGELVAVTIKAGDNQLEEAGPGEGQLFIIDGTVSQNDLPLDENVPGELTFSYNQALDGVEPSTGAGDATVYDVNIQSNLTDTDGSESLSITVTDVPDGASFTDGTENADGSWTFTAEELDGLQMTVDDTVGDDFSLTVTSTSTEASNEDSASTTLTTSVGVNTGPAAGDDSAVLNEDASTVIDVLANDSDVDGDDVYVGSVTEPEHGTVAINEDGTVTYTPDADYNGTDSFTYTIYDGEGNSDTATVNLTVNPENDDPVAVDDTATLSEDASATLNVLGNDTDLDYDSLSLDSVTQPDHGTVTINEDGTVTYTPDANYNGPDSFNYTISDGAGGTDTATVNLTIDPENDAPVATDDSAILGEDSAATLNVLANDCDLDGDTISLDSVTQPEHGLVTINEDGTVTYTPDANYNGADSFTYTISDGAGGTDTATVSLTVNPENDAPVATDDTAILGEDSAATLNVLANDTDLDGIAISLDSVTQPDHGLVTINEDGTVTYTPDADYNGTDSFTYTISDGTGGTDTATVNLTVNPENDDPVATDDSAILAEDSAATLNVLANDTDLDGGTISLDNVTQPEHGLVTVNEDGTVTYTPDANYNGTDSFTYTISDGAGGTDTATVNLTVNSENDAPVAVNDAVSGIEDVAVVIDPETLLANDTDIEGDVLEITAVDSPVGGTVEIVDGNIVFTPDANFSGNASFDYTVTDEAGNISTATTTVDIEAVADAPTVSVDLTLVSQSTGGGGDDDSSHGGGRHQRKRGDDDDDSDTGEGMESVYDLDIQTALTDTDGSESLTLEVTGLPSGATLSAGTLNTDGSWTLTPDQLDGLQLTLDSSVPDDFNLTVTSTSTEASNLDSASSSASASIGVNINPDAADDTATLNEDAAVTIDVLANDTDADGDALSVTEVTQPDHGSVVLNADGTVTYTPDADYNGTDTFTYTVSDGAGGTDTASVNLTVDPANDVPVAVDDTATLSEDASATLNVLGNDSDLDGDTINLDSVTQPDHGTVTINEDGTVTYTPDANYNGADSFTYTISDGAGGTDTATVSLSVTGDADAPVVVADDVSGAEDGGWIGLDLSANLADEDGSETLAITISNVPEGAQLSAGTDLGGGNWTVAPEDLSLLSINPDGDFSGDMNLSISVTSTEAGGDSATVDSAFTVTVTPTGDVTISVDDVTGSEDASEIGLGLSTDSFSIDDADGSEVLQSIEITFTDLPEGAVVNNATYNEETGTYSVPTAAALAIVSVTPPENWSGDFNVTLEVTSNEGSASQSFGVSLSAGNDAPVIDASPVFSMAEDGVITISEEQLLAGASDVDGDALSITDLVVNGGTGTVAGPDADGNYTYTPPENFSGDVSLEYNVSDGTASTPQSANITVAAVADAPDLAVEIGAGVAVVSGGDPLDVSIDIDSVADTDAGFTVTARSIDNEGQLTDASADNIAFHNTSPQGFGVGGSASGADSELGYDSDSGISEQLIVSFDSDVSSVDVSFAWKNSGEDATFDFYKDGIKVGEGTSIGGSDGIDPAVTLSPDNGSSFDQIVFKAPGTGDDYLINSIDFEAVDNAETIIEYPVTISAGLVDTDGSEALSSITIDMEGMPQGVSFSEGGLNADGNWELTPAQLDGLTMTAPEGSGDIELSVSVTSTEADGDAATTTVTATADAPNVGPEVDGTPEFTMNEDGTIIISEAQLLEGATDVDGDTLSVENLVVNGGEGTLTGPGADGNYSYQPSANFSGNVSLSYDVSDGTASVAQTASVAVAGVADTPDLNTGVTGVTEVLADTDVPVSQSLLDQVDADHIVTITGVPVGATLSAGVENADGSWTMTGDVLDGLQVSPPDGYEGEISLDISASTVGETQTLIEADFNSDLDGFTYSDDAFGTSNAKRASGKLDNNDGEDGSGALEVKLGGGDDDDDDSVDMSGGFEQSFTVSEDGTASLTFSYRMDMDSHYENDEYTEVLVSIDGEMVSLDGNDYIARLEGGGDTGWQTVTIDLGSLPEGEHSLVLGGYNNKSTSRSEKTEINFDDLSLTLETSAEEVASESVAFAPDISAHVYGVDVEAALTDASETLSDITFEGLPDGATLNAGASDGEGGWTVDTGDLAGLEVTVPEGSAAFQLTVSATSTEDNGDTATITQTLDFSDHMGADTDDTLAGGDSADTLYGGAGDDALSGEGGDDTLYGGSGADEVTGGDGADSIFGGDGMDALYGGSGVDYLSGGEGDDVIYGESGNDIILGGAGDDQLHGGDGDDEFVFNLGDGNDTIFDFGAGDELSFDGVSLADGDTVEITTDGSDVVITIVGKDGTESNKVTLKDSAGETDSSADSSTGTENVGDGYSVTESADGGVTVQIDQPF